ncbi:MAG TPA: DUF4292 domain-containing protein [Bacteroidales bacterium]|nr:DUF4292 domain-containing protein [Bacteroidales bacterium]
MKNYIVVSFFYFVLFLASCSQTKPVATLKPRELKQITNQQLFDSIITNYGKYETFTAKFSAQLVNPKPIQIKGTIRIQKDSIIWVSITPALNIEAVRCIITPDSIKYINRIDKSYYEGGYEIIQKIAGVPMNYKALQSVLLNEMIFYPFENVIDTAQMFQTYQISKRKNDLVAQNYTFKERRSLGSRRTDSSTVFQSMNIQFDCFRVSEFEIIDDAKNLKVQTKYSFFSIIDSIAFPKILTFEVKSHKKRMEFLLNFEKVEFNIEQTYPFSVNTKYKQIK